MDSEAFKKEIKPHIDSAIEANGGIERVRKIQGLMTSIIDFIAGWVAGSVLATRRSKAAQLVAAAHGTVMKNDLSHEEVRRIYDLVRLVLTTESLTS